MDIYAQHRADQAAKLAGCYSNVEEIRKGEISDRLANGYGSGSKPITFSKTGKQIKEKLPSIESALGNAKTILLSEMVALKAKVGVEPSEQYNSKKYQMLRYPYKMCEAAYDPLNKCYLDATEANTSCQKYNELCWQLLEVEQDLESIKIIAANVEDEKKYELSVGQLVALEFNS